MNEELQVRITADISDLEQGVQQATEEVSKFAKNGESGFSQFNTAITTAGEYSNRFLKATAGAFAGVATALVGLGPATAEYRENHAKLATAFETSGSSAEVAAQTYNDLYRVLGEDDTAVEAAGHLAQLTDDQQALSEWTEICQGVYATFGDSLPIESLTEAANETAQTGSLTGALADALNWAGINEEEFQAKLDACVDSQEREQLIRETLNGTYEDAAAAYEKNAEDVLKQNEAQAALTESLAVLGETMAPVMTMLTELGAEILADLTPHIQAFAEEHMPAIRDALSGIGEKIGVVIGWIADNWQIITTIGGIVLAIASAISLLSTGLTVYNTVMAVASAVSLPMVGIIVGITAAVAALVAGIVLLIKNWDDVKAKVEEVWGNICETVEEAVENIIEWFTDMKDAIIDGASKLKQAATDKFIEIKDNITNKVSEAKDNVVNKFSELKDKATSKCDEVKKNVGSKFDGIKSDITSKMTNTKNTAVSKFEEIKSQATSKIQTLKTNVSGSLSAVGGFFTTHIGGAYNTVKSKFDSIHSTISSTMEKAKSTVSGAVQKLKNLFNFKWELPDIKLPHFSITGKFSLDPPSIPKISVKWYANGGVFEKPTLFPYGNGQLGGLGEEGAEAIVPLEKNTEWLDRIADRLYGRQGKTPIILQVDGKTMAQTTIAAINDLTRQTGHLALNLR